jgi:hypothetical protein
MSEWPTVEVGGWKFVRCPKCKALAPSKAAHLKANPQCRTDESVTSGEMEG